MGRYFGVILAISIALSGGAAADEATDKARQVAASARTNYNLGEYGAAFDQYREAYRLRQDPALLYNIAQCARQLHRYVEASRAYRAYLRERTDLKPAERQMLEVRVAEMDRAAADELARQPPTGTEPATPATAPPPPQAPQPVIAA